uniref:Putative secreted protein n=1 Tax=Anopheles marajoara TaxID=58244 RepID=A0A2M4CDN0_9DIPT
MAKLILLAAICSQSQEDSWQAKYITPLLLADVPFASLWCFSFSCGCDHCPDVQPYKAQCFVFVQCLCFVSYS